MIDNTTNPADEEELDLRTRLNLETGRIHWKEIEGLFARGMAMYVAPHLDLIEVAALTAENDVEKIKPWTEQGLVGALTTEQAKDWQQRDPELWAVVVAPWAFIQERQAAQ
jgi:hypothetical protein